MNKMNVLVLVLAFLSMSAGLLFSFWPLIPVGIAFLVLYGHTTIGITSALLFDIVFGAPVGLLGFLHFPFLLFAVLCVVLRVLSIRLVLPRGDLGTL